MCYDDNIYNKMQMVKEADASDIICHWPSLLQTPAVWRLIQRDAG